MTRAVEAANGATCGTSIAHVATDGTIFRVTPGRDVVQAGAGAGVLALADGAVDVVDCVVRVVDRVVADRADVLRDCESVTRV